MKLLLDTHLVLWRMLDDPQLPPRAIELTDDARNQVEVSAVSVWDVATKPALERDGKPALAMSGSQFCKEPE